MTRIVWLFGLLVSSFAFAGVDHVIVVSIDGGKPAAIFKSKMPVLNSLVAEGAHTFEAQTIYPSTTLPSHTSMLTGVGPAIHKVLWNDWIPAKGTVTVPTIFSLAKSAQHSTALFATKPKFKHLEVKNSLDKFSVEGRDAVGIAKAAAKYLSANKPELLFVHMSDADSAGHSHGWESPQQLRALETVDKGLGILREAILKAYSGESYALIITADHGGHARTHGTASADDMIIPWIAWGNVVKRGVKIARPVRTMDTAATALWLLDVGAPGFEGDPVQDAFAQ